MTDFMDIIKDRRSVRKFEDREINEETLQQVLEAGRWAPSWANTQCWEVVVVKDPQVKAALQETMAKGNPATKAIVEAPVLLVVCGKLQSSGYYKGQVTTKFGDWFLFDLGLFCQNLSLAAHALGLGSVMVGLFDQDKAAEAVKVPEGFELVTILPMGYPAKTPKAPDRRELSEFTHSESF